MASLLGADVVDLQEVDADRRSSSSSSESLRLVVEGVAQQAEQPRERIDRHRVLGLHGGLRDEHGERRLARPDVPE